MFKYIYNAIKKTLYKCQFEHYLIAQSTVCVEEMPSKALMHMFAIQRCLLIAGWVEAHIFTYMHNLTFLRTTQLSLE